MTDPGGRSTEDESIGRVEVRTQLRGCCSCLEEPEGQEAAWVVRREKHRVTLVVTSEWVREYLIWDGRMNSNMMAGFQLCGFLASTLAGDVF